MGQVFHLDNVDTERSAISNRSLPFLSFGVKPLAPRENQNQKLLEIEKKRNMRHCKKE